ncbi:MAG TPA: PQQ-binding-like beta-propeller repeat protein [Pirellulaceae bacterium]|jgi:outer membrane protein assembly factor BamB|nr:PQQ-binding-like beta-propeller repeat protein [Pirellulaceae bacterium]
MRVVSGESDPLPRAERLQAKSEVVESPSPVGNILSAPLRRRSAAPLTPPPGPRAVDVSSQSASPANTTAASAADERLLALIPLGTRDAAPKPLRHGPSVDSSGRLIVTSRNRVAAISIDENDCRIAWTIELEGFVSSAPAIGSDGAARVHADDGNLHYLDADGRRCRPSVAVGSPLAHAGPIVDGGGVTWICRHDGGLLRVDAEGEASLFFRSRQRFDCVPLLHDGRIYVGAGDNFVYAIGLSGRRGESLWNHKAGCGEVAWYVNARPATLGANTILAACRDSKNQLYAFDLEGGLQWSASMPGLMLGAPVVGRDGEIYVTLTLSERGELDRGALVCFDSRSRSIRWTYEIAAAAESTPLIDTEGVVYFGDVSGRVHAVTAVGGAKWQADVESAIRSEGALVGSACVAFVTDDHSVAVLRRD